MSLFIIICFVNTCNYYVNNTTRIKKPFMSFERVNALIVPFVSWLSGTNTCFLECAAQGDTSRVVEKLKIDLLILHYKNYFVKYYGR